MNTKTIRPKKEEDGNKTESMSTKAPLTERIMKKAAATVLAVGIAVSPMACSLLTDFEIPRDLDVSHDGDVSDSDADSVQDAEVDGSQDADVNVVDSDIRDGNVSDADILDGDVEEDADVVDSDVVDADEDSDVADADVVDGDLADSDITDGDVLDGDVEEDADLEPLCSGVFDEVITEETFDKGTGRSVGGYMITYVTQTTGGITMNIDCGSDSEEITSGDAITTMVEHTVNVPDDGKRIRITVHSRNTFDATMSVAVEPL